MRVTWIACALGVLSLGAALTAGEPARPKAAPEEIEAWIQDLAAEEYRVREEADRNLRAAGKAAMKKLQRTIETTTDAETRHRAERIVSELTAGPRIAAAVADLGHEDWDKVTAAIETLLGEFGQDHGAEEAVEKAARRNDPRGQMAKVIQAQVENLKRQREQYAKLAEQRPEAAEQYRRAEAQLEQWMRRNVLQSCEHLHKQKQKP